ncbi:MAG TPA: hypothetical protein VHO06_03315 [Polyangia bacterium]|nr:hypothetical protein [Polyangia bacterium]
MRLGRLLLLCAGLAAGCSGAEEPHGSPVLVGVYWIVGGRPMQVWSTSGADAGAATPAAQEVDFVYDRLLDGNRIEDSVTQNGTTIAVPKATPPITVSWADEATAMSAPPFSDRVLYNSEPIYGGTTAYVLLQPTQVGFPSSDTVTFALDKTGLTSAYGDQMTGPAQISVPTGPFAASFRLPSGSDASATVAATFALPVLFTNRVGAASAVAPFIRVRAGGAPLPVTVAVDASDATVVDVSPASCLGGWPTGVAIEVAVAAGLPDAFGAPMPAGATATFMAAGAAPPAPDGGCGPTDGGVD